MKETGRVAVDGTKVFLDSNGLVNIVPSDRAINYSPKPDEKEVVGVTGITIEFPLHGVVKATIELFYCFDAIKTIPCFLLLNPDTGEKEEVQFIRFKSGKVWGNE